MRSAKHLGILFTILLLSTIFVPVVDASTPSPVAESIIMRINADDTINWTDTMNGVNASEASKSNFNQTIDPFLVANPDIRGIVVAPYFSPVVVNQTFDHRNISIAQYFKVRPDIVIDGVSEVWVMLPVMDLPDNVNIRVRVGRIDTQQNAFNLTFTSFGTPAFTGSVAKIYDVTDASTNYHDFRRDQSDQYAATSFYWNFTWVHCSFGMMPNEYYVMVVDISYPGNTAGTIKLAVAQDDFWADSIYNSWFWLNGTSKAMSLDFGMAMILTTGMGSGVTGLAVDSNLDSSAGATIHYNSSIPFHQTLTERYLELVIPVMFTQQHTSMLNISMKVTIYSSVTDATIIHAETRIQTFTATISPFLFDIDLNAHIGATVDHIRVDTYAWTNNSLDLKLWAYQYYKTGANFNLAQAFTDIYWLSSTNVVSAFSKEYFIPFGSITQSPTYWAYADKPIVVIPIETPNSTTGIIQAMRNMEGWFNARGNVSMMFGWIVDSIDMLVWTVENLWKSLYDLATGLVSYLLYPFVSDFIDWFLNQSDPAGGNIFGIGIWLFDILIWFIDAIQYVSYYIIRAVYSFSLLIVYIINIYGVISINTALLAYSKTGRMSDFIRTFRAGWKFVYGIIALLISLALLAISILGALIPL